jgi:hypothetical protein
MFELPIERSKSPTRRTVPEVVQKNRASFTARCEMSTQMMEVPVPLSTNAKGDGLIRARLLALESQQADLGARLAGLEGVVFAVMHQLTLVQRDLHAILQATHAKS